MNVFPRSSGYRDIEGADAAIFLDWTWSLQARTGREIFERWAGEFPHPIETLVISPDDDPAAAEWVLSEGSRLNQPLHGGGHGSLLFVRHGHVVAWIPEVHRTDVREIERVYRQALAAD